MVRTTHFTGPATDLGLHLVDMFFLTGDALTVARRHAALRAGKIVAFALGAAAAVPVAHRYGFLAFLVPAALTASATALSFVPVLAVA